MQKDVNNNNHCNLLYKAYIKASIIHEHWIFHQP